MVQWTPQPGLTVPVEIQVLADDEVAEPEVGHRSPGNIGSERDAIEGARERQFPPSPFRSVAAISVTFRPWLWLRGTCPNLTADPQFALIPVLGFTPRKDSDAASEERCVSPAWFGSLLYDPGS